MSCLNLAKILHLLVQNKRQDKMRGKNMLDYVIKQTVSFLENMPKSKRKKKGQFFTSAETAMFMADMFDVNILPTDVTILDPGAGTGTGILSSAVVERLLKEDHINNHLKTYEFRHCGNGRPYG
jgi:type I restriction-modification system DNA methylase subunit